MNKNRLLIMVGMTIFFASLVMFYYATIAFSYPIPPGDDSYVHLNYLHSWIQSGTPLLGIGYPPGFHFLVFVVSNIAGVSLIDAMKWVVPALLPVSGLCLAWLATKIFSRPVGLLTLGLYSLVALQPMQTFYDGGFPNLLATGSLVPLLFGSIFCSLSLVGKRKTVWSLVSVGLLATIVLTHHFTLIILLLVLIPWALILIGSYVVSVESRWLRGS